MADETETVWRADKSWGNKKVVVAKATVKRTPKAVTILSCESNAAFDYRTRLSPEDVSPSRESALKSMIERVQVEIEQEESKIRKLQEIIYEAEIMLYGE